MNRALLIVGLALMDACWIYPWTLLLGLWTSGEPLLLSPVSVLALLLIGAFLTWWALRVFGSRRPGQVLLVGTGLLLSLLVVRVDDYPAGGAFNWLPRLGEAIAIALGHPTAPAVGFAAALLLWRRGVQLGSSSPTLPDVDGAFRWNIGALIAFAVLLGIAVRPSVQPAIEVRATPFVVGSFFVGLLTLALARLESLRTRTHAVALNTQWLAALIVVAGVLVLSALAVSQVLSFDTLVLATRPLFDVLGRVVLVLLYAIVIPLAWLIELIVYWLMAVFSPGSQSQPPEPMQPQDINALLSQLLGVIPPEAMAALKVVGALLLLGLALLLVARTIARWRPRTAELDGTLEERESVWQRGQLRALLLAWLRRLLRRDRPAPVLADLAGSPSPSPSAASVSSVRELYRQLLALGAAWGKPRPTSATPYEHQPALTSSLAPPTAVSSLTEAYVQVRYAETEPSPEQLQALRTTLEAVTPVENDQ